MWVLKQMKWRPRSSAASPAVKMSAQSIESTTGVPYVRPRRSTRWRLPTSIDRCDPGSGSRESRVGAPDVCADQNLKPCWCPTRNTDNCCPRTARGYRRGVTSPTALPWPASDHFRGELDAPLRIRSAVASLRRLVDELPKPADVLTELTKDQITAVHSQIAPLRVVWRRRQDAARIALRGGGLHHDYRFGIACGLSSCGAHRGLAT